MIETTLLIENLSDTTTESDLIALFSGVGRVRGVKLRRDHATEDPGSYALLELATEEGVDRAISRLDGHNLEGSRIKVCLADGQRGPRVTGGKMWGAGHANARPKGSRRGARKRKRGL
ncbi:MAG: RNA-binding protein [Acidobacteria bacterium]|nr:RNA-binding protein [Acidobacteriota bacterium]MCB9378608.1 RNA-binding protein [Holophagales bacterium]